MLTFEEMINWEEWQAFEGGDNEIPTHCLKYLCLKRCPLRGKLHHLPSLIELEILECNQLEAKPSSLIWIKSIEKLKIEEGSEGLLSLLDCNSWCLLQVVEMWR
ncbi:hypothetical protein L6164_016940 [Bauhinia variegata]|uniref:Uncharacterized protein n=1 Tax=Bauhinia variegata TaxID=167791 RepID=A0ACB9N7W1_BAUVA|nr:hypothetical protein L6164_016940 [Bauhinia variegata]